MTNEVKQKIYITMNGNWGDDVTGVAVCEDGNVLAGHVCSSESFFPHDFGITSTWKHESYDKHCGKGNWELILDVEGTNIPKEVRVPIPKPKATKKGSFPGF